MPGPRDAVRSSYRAVQGWPMGGFARGHGDVYIELILERIYRTYI